MSHFEHEGTYGEFDDEFDTHYGCTLHTLAIMNDLVPVGWRESYDQMIHSLRAAAHPCRAHVGLDPFTIDQGEMVLKTSEDEPVLQGILRKFSRRMGHTCRECGLPGTRRIVGLKEIPLCSVCYGKRRLRQDLQKLLDDIESAPFRDKGVYVETDIPPRAMLTIPETAWRTLGDPSTKTLFRCITLDSLLHELPRLKSLKNQLDATTGYDAIDFSSRHGDDHG